MSRMADYWAEKESESECSDYEFDHWQELITADPEYEIWAKLYEADMEELSVTGSKILEQSKQEIR